MAIAAVDAQNRAIFIWRPASSRVPTNSSRAQASTAAETPSHCMTSSDRLSEPRKEPSVDQ